MKSNYRKHDKKYFYKYTAASTAKTIIATNTLRWSSPLLFNDPFDTVRIIKTEFSDAELQKEIIELSFTICDYEIEKRKYSGPSFSYLCDLLKNVPIEDRKKYKDELLSGIHEREFAKYKSIIEVQKIWDELIKKSRIFCMTEDNNNDTMWAHYGDGHRGVIIELECLDIYDSPLLVAQKVNYSDDNISVGDKAIWRDLIIGKNSFDYDLLFGPLEIIKKKNWSYEKEWRIISSDLKSNELYETVHIHPLTFSSVILGFNISGEDKNDIINLAKEREPKIKVQESTINQKTRKIEYNYV